MKRSFGKRGLLLGVMLAIVISVAGCGDKTDFETDEDTVFVLKNGEIRAYIQSDFTESYYDQAELIGFIEDTVDEYVKNSGEDTVVLTEFAVQDDVAHAWIDYASVMDYEDFNGVEFFEGSVIAAQADGYKFLGKYAPVEEGKLSVELVNGSEFKDDESLKCVIIGQATAVDVSGDIVYVSDGNVELIGPKRARVSFDKLDVDAKPGYIIYKR